MNNNNKFEHGVASGDPLSDRLIIWTRVTPGTAVEAIEVRWELAGDPGFGELLQVGSARASADHDYTVKVDVTGLRPGTLYYYRFRVAGAVSAVGKARTLPVGAVERVRLAVVACANYPAGHFNVYAEAARRDDFDAVIHLGDYLYEYGMGGYATENAEAIGRALPADCAGDAVSLADYRRRYALYRTDPDLQALHAAAPFIAVWDDHEIANDTWREGAENHAPRQGDFGARRRAAMQAWFEWMPVRVPADRQSIYRSFRFGDLLELHMLDTRVIGRDRQLDYADYLGAQGVDVARLQADLTRPGRTLLGAQQRQWLLEALEGGSALWQVLGQQVLCARMNVPAELLGQIATASPSVLQAFAELTALRARFRQAPHTLSPEQLARVTQPALPYNLDGWDGYPEEREAVLAAAREWGRNLVVLAGDTHNAWASRLTLRDGAPVGVELAAPAVSSPGLEAYLGMSAELVESAEQAFTTLVDDLEYANVSQRGFMTVTFTRERVESEWCFVDTVASRDYRVVGERAQTMEVLPAEGGVRTRVEEVAC